MSEWRNPFGECEPERRWDTNRIVDFVFALLDGIEGRPFPIIHFECTGNCDTNHGEVSNSGSLSIVPADERFDRNLTDADIIFLHEYARVSSR